MKPAGKYLVLVRPALTHGSYEGDAAPWAVDSYALNGHWRSTTLLESKEAAQKQARSMRRNLRRAGQDTP